LIEAVTAVGKPTVAVVAMGRPQGLASIIDRLPTILTAYYAGPHKAPPSPMQYSVLPIPQANCVHAASSRGTGADLTIRNSAKRRGTEIVQLYAADTAIGIILPAQQLIGFARVDLDAGASLLSPAIVVCRQIERSVITGLSWNRLSRAEWPP
jgi:hypothetical protein